MNADSSKGAGITADPRKVRPGMIYVDLSCRMNKRQIYQAYEKGAALIFTPYDISDPDLPVIKVEGHQNTLYMLFDRLFGKQEYKPKLIGLLGDSDKCVLLELIQSILYTKDDNKRMMDIIPITIDTIGNNLSYFNDIVFDCAILTDRGSLKNSYGNQNIIDFISRLTDKKAIIINNDEYYDIKSSEDLSKIKSITYGLNKKAAVTASSIDINEITCFNYCVQRSFRTRSGKRVESFEIPIRLNILGSSNIYNALAAITCGLYYDEDIANIKYLIENYKAPPRHFQKIYDGDFTIIDNYCSSIHDLTAAFDYIQILSYNNLILIISLSYDSNTAFHEEKARLISEWAKMLKCKEVILTSCMDGDSHGEFPLKCIRIYKKAFNDNDIPFIYYHLLNHAIEKGLSMLNKHDLMVMLGSDEMSVAHKLLYRRLRPVSNKKN